MNDPKTYDDGVKKTRHGADLNLGVAQDKARASKLDPGRDASAVNAARAKLEGWSRTDWKGWPVTPAKEG
jgi:hypothetical protein